MKKILFVLAFGLISFSVFPCQGTNWNSCGLESTHDMIIDAFSNCCAGNFTITDLCNNYQVTFVSVSQDGPNSSCIGG
jgi:hypothetical protein